MTERILIVEDEPDIRATLEYNLHRENYLTESVGTILEAEKILKETQISIILLDLMLPDGSGLDLCRKLKSEKESSSIPIIILTAKDDEVDKVVGFELGADDYVTKPFSVRELILRIKAILKRGSKKPEILEVEREFGDLKIDTESHEVFVNDKPLKLTKKEFELLQFFISNKNKVITKTGLAEYLWGDYMDVADSFDFIYGHIKNLRKKLINKG